MSSALQSLTRFFSAPLAPPPVPGEKAGREPAIDALRALAALLVVIQHLPKHDSYAFLIDIFGAGREGVLLFFVISGYVIGRSCRGPAPNSFAGYWRRRVLRLVPLYVLALAAAVAATFALGQHASLRDVLVHLAFLQNFEPYFGLWLAPLSLAQPFWTLNYEFVFYGLFLLVWRFTPRAGVLLAICLMPPLLAPWLPINAHFIASYCAGFAFWLAGLALAWRTSPVVASGPGPLPLLGLLFAFVAAAKAAPWQVLLGRLNIDPAPTHWVPVGDLVQLPLAAALVAYCAGALPRPGAKLRLLFLSPSLAVLACALATGHSLADQRWRPVALCAALAAVLLFRGDDSPALVRRLAPWGLVSYAIYLFHLPIARLLEHTLGAVPAALLLLPIVLPLSWFLERTVQPWLLARLHLSRQPASA